jgi:hypothetical protein
MTKLLLDNEAKMRHKLRLFHAIKIGQLFSFFAWRE